MRRHKTMRAIYSTLLTIFFTTHAYGQYGRSEADKIAAGAAAEANRMRGIYQQQQEEQQWAAAVAARNAAEVAKIYAKDPWRKIGTETNLARGKGWYEFQGEVQTE